MKDNKGFSVRNSQIDFIRSFALLTIFINHIPGNIFESLTSKNFGFSDGAEIFVLISGMSVGLSLHPSFEKGKRFFLTLKLFKRSFLLYCVHILTNVATLSIFCFGVLFSGNLALLKENNIDVLIHDPLHGFPGLMLLSHQLGYNNILSLYLVLFLFTPLILYGLWKNRLLSFFISFLIWLIAGTWQIAPLNYPSEGFWFLNPLSWQILFFIGIVLMIYAKEDRLNWLKKKRIALFLTLFSVFYLCFSCILIHSSLWGHEVWFHLPIVLGGFDKTFLSISRLLHILCLSYLVYFSGVLGYIMRFRFSYFFALLGKRPLPVFIAGTLFAMAAQVLNFTVSREIFFNIFIICLGILFQFSLAFYLEWFSKIKLLSLEPSSKGVVV